MELVTPALRFVVVAAFQLVLLLMGLSILQLLAAPVDPLHALKSTLAPEVEWSWPAER